MTDRDIPISRCSLKGMAWTFTEDVDFDKRVTTGEESLGGSGGYVAQRGTADYNIRATIGGIAGAINGVLDVGEDAVACAKKKSTSMAPKP
jgi:hypothetical protein